MTMNIIIADDHDIVREGLCSALHVLDDNITIYQAANARELMALLHAHQNIELIVLDLFMPDCNGVKLVSEIGEAYKNTIILVLSASENGEDMQKVIDAGAAGFVPKSAGREVLISALRLVLAGGTYIPPELIYGVSKSLPYHSSEPSTDSLADTIDSLSDLTQRQKDVLKLTVEGKTNKEIARLLDISLIQ